MQVKAYPVLPRAATAAVPPRSASSASDASEAADWTVLVYHQDSTAGKAGQSLSQELQVARNSQVNVALHTQHQAQGLRGWLGGIEHQTQVIGSGPAPAQEPTNLKDFLAWGVKAYPARHYAVVVRGAQAANPQELSGALAAAGRPIDLVAIESPMGARLDLAYELTGRAGVLVAAPDRETGVGQPTAAWLTTLCERSAAADGEDLGRIMVGATRERARGGIKTALDLDAVGVLGAQLKSVVDSLIAARVPRDLIYTSMLESPSMEPGDCRREEFNQRDLGGFLRRVNLDERFPANCRAAAREALSTLGRARLAHHVGHHRQETRRPTGLAAYMPYQAEEELPAGRLSSEVGWGRLVDYVFAESGPLSPPVAAPTDGVEMPDNSGMTRKLGKWALWNYKKFVSPFLETTCNYTPSCSQYTREAIEKHGLIQGGKLGFLRLISCTGHNHGHDPVPESPDGPTGPEHHNHEGHDHEHEHQEPRFEPRLGSLLTPPPVVHRSPGRQKLESGLVKAAALGGRVLAGVVGATLALPAGLAIGAFLAQKAGSGRMDEFTQSMLAKHNKAAVRTIVDAARKVGKGAYATHEFVARTTGSQTLARVVGGTVGVLTGSVLGAIGGAVGAFSWFGGMGSIWGANRMNDALGQLARNPYNESILQQDYQS